jgi:hypothetical protein
MPMWVWVLIGVGSYLGLALLVGVALGRVFGLGARISELYETEDCSTMPIARDVDQQPRSPADVEMGRTAHDFEQAPV